MRNLIFILASFPLILIAQEDCFNGIDDDGDGLIDIQDVDDCSCTNSLTILEKSFEEKSCCPTGRNYATLIDCLDEDWLSPNGSADYFNTCGWMGDEQTPFVPLPMPSGDGVIGIASFTESFGSPHPFYESIVTCLDAPMVSGEAHEMSFYVGFGIDQGFAISTLDITIALYGKTNCDALWVGNDECLINNGWELITEIPVSSPFVDNWVFTSKEFTPNENYASIGIAVTCGDYPIGQYHFLDDIKIKQLLPTEQLEDLVSTGDCIQGVSVELPNANGNEFQWYLDGVAINGATSNPHFVSDPTSDGVYQVMVMNDNGCILSDPIQIQIDKNILQVNGIVNNPLCNGEASGSIDVTTNSNNAPYSYQWSTGATDGVISNLEEGNYQVTITDANGCVGSNSFTINEPTPLNISANFIDTICPELSTNIVIQASGGSPTYDFLWDNGNTNDTLVEATSGDYEVTVTDLNGCSEIESIKIYEYNPIIVTPKVEDSICSGQTTDLFLDISGGNPSYDVTWNDGSTSDSLLDRSSGNYHWLIVDKVGCSVSDSITIFEKPNPILDFEITPSGCNANDDGAIDLSISNEESPVFIEWSNSSVEEDQTELAPGWYSVTVSSTNGCSTNDSVLIETLMPSLSLTSSTGDIPCNNQANGYIDLEITNNQYPYDIFWEDGDTTDFREDLDPGTYSVQIIDSIGCILNKEFEIKVLSDLEVSNEFNNVDCHGEETGNIDVSVSNANSTFEILWSDGSNILERKNLPAGVYSYMINDSFGCTYTDTIILNEGEEISYLIDVDSPNCHDSDDGSIIITPSSGTSPFNFIWNTGDMTNEIKDLSAGSYTFNISDSIGCSITDTIFLQEQSSIDVEAQIQNVRCYNDTTGFIELDVNGGLAPYQYTWDNNQSTSKITNLSSGTYSVIVNDVNGCTTSSIFEIQQPDKLSVTEDIFTPFCPDENGNISLNVSGGVEPYEYNWSSGDTENEITIIPGGSYFVTVSDANSCTTSQTFNVAELNKEITFIDTKEVINGKEYVVIEIVNNSEDDNIFSTNWNIDNTIECLEQNELNACTKFSIEVKQAETLELIVTTEDGCEYAYKYELVFQEDEKEETHIYIPNALSFRTQGNNIFKVMSNDSDLFIDRMNIYDRWGNLVYTDGGGDQNSIFWEGDFDGKRAVSGVYVFFIQAIKSNGEPLVLKGDITVLN